MHNLPTPANAYIGKQQISPPRRSTPKSEPSSEPTLSSTTSSSFDSNDLHTNRGQPSQYDENSLFFPDDPTATYTGNQYRTGFDPFLPPSRRPSQENLFYKSRPPTFEAAPPPKSQPVSQVSSLEQDSSPLLPSVETSDTVESSAHEDTSTRPDITGEIFSATDHTQQQAFTGLTPEDVARELSPLFFLPPDEYLDLLIREPVDPVLLDPALYDPVLMPEQDVSRRQPLSRNWSPAAAKNAPTLQNPPSKTVMPASKIMPTTVPASRKVGPRQTSLKNFFGSSPGPAPSAVAAADGLFYGESAKFAHEEESPVKRRRVSEADEANWLANEVVPPTEITSSPRKSQYFAPPPEQDQNKVEKRRGGFIVDSDDSGDEAVSASAEGVASEASPVLPSAPLRLRPKNNSPSTETTEDMPVIQALDGTFDETRPPLMRQDTSLYTPGEFGDEDFTNDEFYEEGEEFLERRWMEEQAAMEAAFDEDSKSEDDTESVQTPKDDFDLPVLSEDSVSLCPICSGSLKGLSEAQASSHVNACLDGTAPPLPKATEEAPAPPVEPKSRSASPFRQPAKPAHRFQRSAIARPPQANPFSAAKDGKAGGSAFTRLMSGHAEDIAWAEAASNEKDSRGKPAYQRTCPFYKIMPGMYICVDAFRYGKVEGQNAYFLSHFHSDHYIGLTANWSHGPIYASKVTCNLMRQQLKVDPKWIRPLEFEKKYEIPDTNGVRVTMLPANHCPGSSLYLFEKVTGKNRDSSDRMHRILHCGDFRACPAHVNHPLLRPNVVDAVTGATKEQWIDTCYLDTTYLTPKYAFPSQSDVIDACAAMCVSLSNEIANPDDIWEQARSVRMGSTMTKFLEAGSTTAVKPEVEEDDKTSLKNRGRLLVVIGTYSIGKERICLGIAKALNSKIYAPPNKMKICRALEDKELNARLTSNKFEAQVHMQILFEIRAETLHDYLVQHKPHFSRVVGFRPTGWNYRPPTSRFTENPAVDTILHSDGWKSRFGMKDLVPQRGSTKESNCFGVPYSEHSSFRELTMFCCALRIKKVIPTVNVGSAKGREKMKKWIEKWEVERRKKGLFEWKAGEGGSGGESEKFEGLHYGV